MNNEYLITQYLSNEYEYIESTCSVLLKSTCTLIFKCQCAPFIQWSDFLSDLDQSLKSISDNAEHLNDEEIIKEKRKT